MKAAESVTSALDLSVSLDQLKLQVDRPRKPKWRSKGGGARTDLLSPAWVGRKAGKQGSLQKNRAHAAVRSVGREAHQRVAKGSTEHYKLGG